LKRGNSLNAGISIDTRRDVQGGVKRGVQRGVQRVARFHIAKPTALGSFALLFFILSVLLGVIRKEIVLLLCGVATGSVLLYCFLCICLLYLLRIKKIFSLPAICVRYSVKLFTLDAVCAKTIIKIFPVSVFTQGVESLKIEDVDFAGTGARDMRGAYYRRPDELIFFDMFNFFCLRYKVGEETHVPFLLIHPKKIDTDYDITSKLTGGKTVSGNLIKTDSMPNENRPYIPGDDPRRINWKLYGHSNELFVRENERENKLLTDASFFIDTTVSKSLYRKNEYNNVIDRFSSALLAIFVNGIKSNIMFSAMISGVRGEYGGEYTDLRTEAEVYNFFAYPFVILKDDENTVITGDTDIRTTAKHNLFVASLSKINKYELRLDRGGVNILSAKI
jgi:hypothetical protein